MRPKSTRDPRMRNRAITFTGIGAILIVVLIASNSCIRSGVNELPPNPPTPAQTVSAYLDRGAIVLESFTVQIIQLHGIGVLSTADADAILSTVEHVAREGERATEMTRVIYEAGEGADIQEFMSITTAMAQIAEGMVDQLPLTPEFVRARQLLLIAQSSFQLAQAFTEGFHAHQP